MERDNVVKLLNSLIQLDIDAVHAYTQAIERIDVADVRQNLESFRSDHERHIRDLSESVRSLGGEPVEHTRDFKGFLIEGFTALRSITGTEGALKAMKSNERLTNAKYQAALDSDLPGDVNQIVMRNREDERRHLEYIERCIDQKVWERGGQAPQPQL